MIVFDDIFEHEVWNLSKDTRIVLIVDINHPELSEEKRVWYQKRLTVMGYEMMWMDQIMTWLSWKVRR